MTQEELEAGRRELCRRKNGPLMKHIQTLDDLMEHSFDRLDGAYGNHIPLLLVVVSTYLAHCCSMSMSTSHDVILLQCVDVYHCCIL